MGSAPVFRIVSLARDEELRDRDYVRIMPIRRSRALLVLAALSMTACVEAGQPTGGRATLAGYDVATQPSQVRQNIGFLSANTALYDRMSAWVGLARRYRRGRRGDQGAAEA